MKSYNVMCPVCGKINQNLNLEETNGWMECEHCQQTVQVSFEMDIALPSVTLTNVATCLQSHNKGQTVVL